MARSNVYFTVPVPQPCWGYLRVGRTIYEVEVTEIHNEPDGVIKNTVVCPPATPDTGRSRGPVRSSVS